MRLMHDGAMFHTAYMTVNLLPCNQIDCFIFAIMANSPDVKSKLAYLTITCRVLKRQNPANVTQSEQFARDKYLEGYLYNVCGRGLDA